MVIAFTGHRPNKLDSDYRLSGPKVIQIRSDIVKNLAVLPAVSEFIVGGALGIDMLAALIACEFNVPYTVAVPCLNQDAKWNPACKSMYAAILERARKVYYVSNTPYDSICMQKRNEWMVNNCDTLYAVWDGSNGGTGNCIKYALDKKPIILHRI